MTLFVKKLNPAAQLPKCSTAGAAGYDLAAVEHATILPGKRAIVKTGLALSIPLGAVGLIWPRSGLAVKYGIDVLAGVIDHDYRGDVGVVLINHGEDVFFVDPGDRIAQLLIQPVMALPVCEVCDLSKTDRGEGGFGSTGA